MPPTDRDLICRYVDGDEAAFEAFYGRHWRPVFVYLLSLVRDRPTAEELLQETMVSFLRGLGRVRPVENLRPLLVTTARNLAIDHVRRTERGRKAMEKRLEDPLFRGRAADVTWSGRVDSGADGERLHGLLVRLPDVQQEVVVLRVLVEMTFVEIARLLEIPESTVLSRYRYAITKLRAGLEKGSYRASRT